MKEKRRPIRRQMNKIVLFIVVTALLFASTAAIGTMLRIRDTSRTALVDRMETRLRETVENKADLANETLNSYADRVAMLVVCAEDMYAHPDRYLPCEVPPPRPGMGGRLTMQRYLANETIQVDDLYAENCLLGNLEPLFRSVMESEDATVTGVYIATTSGLLLSYSDIDQLGTAVEQGESYFEFRDAGWYRSARDLGRLLFTDIYYDHYGRGAMISCACPVYRDGVLKAVICLDIRNNDLQSDIFSMSLPEGSYAFLVDSSRKVIADTRGAKNTVLNDGTHGDKFAQAAICSNTTDVYLGRDGTYYAHAPVRSNGWKLCIAVPQESVLLPIAGLDKEIANAQLTFLALLLGIVAAAAAAVHLFAKQITHPLSELQKDAEIISSGNLDRQAKVLHNDEVGDLAESFNRMTRSLRTYIDDLTRVTAETERIGAELDVATRIQKDMLPGVFPPFPNHREFDLYAVMTPAREVGGDFYDFFMLDEDHLALVIADVSGKGVPAALFMMVSMIMIHDHAALQRSPAETLRRVNDIICARNDACMFVTTWLGILELSTGTLTAANAGHENPILREPGGDFQVIKNRHGLAVGAMEGVSYADHVIRLAPGSTLFLYTDGVAEAENAAHGQFGVARILDTLNAADSDDPEVLLPAVRAAADVFVGDTPQFDDFTMLGVTYHGPQSQG